MTLLGAISYQLTNVWTMRSWEFSAFSVGLFSNPLLIGAMVIELAWIWMLLYVEPYDEITTWWEANGDVEESGLGRMEEKERMVMAHGHG